MKRPEWIADLLSTEEGRRLLERERVLVEATEILCRLMDSKSVSSAELARRLGVSPARVSMLLSGTRNLTLASLAEAFHVLGRSMHISHGPHTDRVQIGTRPGRISGPRASNSRRKAKGALASARSRRSTRKGRAKTPGRRA